MGGQRVKYDANNKHEATDSCAFLDDFRYDEIQEAKPDGGVS